LPENENRETRVVQLVRASPPEAYEAFVSPAALVEWLPPGEMTGNIEDFDRREGGGYRMSLFYPPDDRRSRGKTSEREDAVDVRFLELEPPSRIVEAVRFLTPNPLFRGVMTITITFVEMPGGTEITFLCTGLPPGLSPEDNEAGTRLSLQQLAQRFE
jgi:uncharacterized protein YndB with AHSA1/START domain